MADRKDVCSSDLIGKTSTMAGQIPILTRTQMVKNGSGIGRQKHAYIANTGIHHIGNSKINNPITSCNWQRRNRTMLTQLLQHGVGTIQLYNTHHITQNDHSVLIVVISLTNSQLSLPVPLHQWPLLPLPLGLRQ